ncbi:MAG: Outer membrane protein assembly factor BamD [Verrucomicrobiae bacterium]|nr:Outer membrane protein assembly factor BamD [Verrucomicrobiae bacterium]
MINTLRLLIAGMFLASLTSYGQAPKAPPTIRTAQVGFQEAQTAYSEGDWPKALAAFQKFEKEFPFSLAVPDSIYYQGWCWANQTRYQEAINVFQRLMTSFPGNVLVAEALLKQAECYREMQDAAKAVELYRKFQQQFPAHEMLPQAMLGEAWATYKAGNTNGAKTIIRIVQQKYLENAGVQLDALFLLGQVYTEEKDFQSANKVYREITKQRSNPRATEALYLAAEAMFNRGEALSREGKTEEANKAFRDAIGYFKGVRSKAALLEVLQRDIDQLNAVRGQLGLEVWQRRTDAVRRLMTQIKDRPDLRVLALFRVANCYQALEMPEESSVVYQYLLDRYPNDRAAEQIWFGLIQTLTQRGQSKKAGELSEEFKKKYPNAGGTESVQMMQAESQFQQLRYKEALAGYVTALESTKNQATIELIEFRIATCHFNLEDFPKALEAFTGFTTKRTDSKIRPDALFFLGLTHYEIANRSGDTNVARPNLEAGIKAYEEIRAKYPEYDKIPTVTFRMGYLYSYLGAYDAANYDKAIAMFEEFIKKWPSQPELPEAWYQIARNNISAERLDAAIAAYKTLVEKYPDHDLAPFAAWEIATSYASMKPPKMAEVVEALRHFVQKYPNHPRVGDALYAIATELENTKRYDEAIPAYQDIVNRALAAETLSDDARNAAVAAVLRIAAILELRNDPKTVAADLEQFLGKFSNDPLAARTLVGQIARVYTKNRQSAEANTKLEALAQQYAANTAIRHACVIGMTEIALTEKNISRANALVVRLLADPNKSELPASGFLTIGNVSLRTDKFAQAKESYDAALATAGNDQKVQTLAEVGLGQALLGLKQYDAAQEALEKALKDTQHVPRSDAELALAKVYEAKNRIEAAVPLYSNVLRDSKGDPAFEAAHRLGNIFFNMVSPDPVKTKDNKKTALAYYARLLFAPVGPMSDEAAYRTGECHEALGNAAQACSVFQSYLKRYSAGAFVDQAKEKIRKLCAP